MFLPGSHCLFISTAMVVVAAAVAVVVVAAAAAAVAAGGGETHTMTGVAMTAMTDMTSTTIGMGE